jgi:maleate isomerase
MLTVPHSPQSGPEPRGLRTVLGRLSGKEISIPDHNGPPMPALANPGVILDGQKVEGFAIDSARGYPDVRSFRHKFGLLLPATNTSMEHELWSMILKNEGSGALDGIGLHTSVVLTPKPQLRSAEDLSHYKQQFLAGLRTAVDTALLAEPQSLIMGMSLEHIIYGLDDIRAVVADVESHTGLPWATWHEAAAAALKAYNAKRIGIITPFDATGNRNATRMFEDMGSRWLRALAFRVRMRCILRMCRTGPRRRRSSSCWPPTQIASMRWFNAAPT